MYPPDLNRQKYLIIFQTICIREVFASESSPRALPRLPMQRLPCYPYPMAMPEMRPLVRTCGPPPEPAAAVAAVVVAAEEKGKRGEERRKGEGEEGRREEKRRRGEKRGEEKGRREVNLFIHETTHLPIARP